MEAGSLTASVSERLRRELGSLDGIIGAVIDEGSASILLIYEPDAESAPLEPQMRDILLTSGVDPGSVRLEFIPRPGHGARRRVRFKCVERIPEGGGIVAIRVTLEWHDREIVGEVSGEATETIELRSAAAATIKAVEALLGSGVGLRLTGVKQTRAFDTELIITSVHRMAPPQQHYVGAAIVRGDDPLRSACLSILHALNRMMGNFLATSD